MVHTRGPWEFRCEAKGRWYAYPVQRAVAGGDERRQRNGLTASAHAAWRFHTGFRLFAQYDFEMSDENVVAADYEANTVSTGIEMEM